MNQKNSIYNVYKTYIAFGNLFAVNFRIQIFLIFYPILQEATIICAVFWQLLWFYFAPSDPRQHQLKRPNSILRKRVLPHIL